MVAQFSTHRIRFSLQIIYLSNTELDIVERLSELVLALLLLALKDSVDFGFDLLRLLEKRTEELVPLMHLKLRLVLVEPQLFLSLGVPLVALLHIVIGSSQPILILVHAEL